MDTETYLTIQVPPHPSTTLKTRTTHGEEERRVSRYLESAAKRVKRCDARLNVSIVLKTIMSGFYTADHPYRQSAVNQDLKVYGDISIDQILAKANIKENVGDIASGLMELDIIVDKSVKTPSSYRANINKDETRRWQTDIHYEIDDEMSLAQEVAIRKAIPVWQKYSCLSFHENKQAYNRIKFKLVTNNVCASPNVGMNQGLQLIQLGETCFKVFYYLL
ncbi:uncharacterized protein LOC132751474 [Ruditapes philippinarum]|uniref:uncharacterized protein LOC132751474 n=1 Tax=Ruditapes philippinarum TaxID=129788 RepID=UPI00295BE7C4|nr:uncharacterized protein LOC132751474 [Ruditapes philippinarum]